MVYISIVVAFFLVGMNSNAMELSDQELLEHCGATTQAPLLEFPFQLVQLMPIVIYRWNGKYAIHRMTAYKKSNLYGLSEKDLQCIKNENFVITDNFTIIKDPSDKSSVLAGAIILNTKDNSLFCKLKCANLWACDYLDKMMSEKKNHKVGSGHE